MEKTVRYWRNGTGKPPEERVVPVVIDQDENMNSVWNKNKNQQRIGNDQVVFQMEKAFYCSRSRFSPPPKKGRRLELDNVLYEVLGVETEGGMLRIELRELEE